MSCRISRFVRVSTVCLAVLASAAVGRSQLTFLSNYTTDSLGGRDGTALQNSTNSAMTSLAAYFTNNIKLNVQVTLQDLGNAQTLGTSSANFSQISGSGPYYATPLYNALTNTDVNGGTTAITITMNTNAGINWGLGTGAPGSTNYSWQSVVMHEVLHSMGFYDGIGAVTTTLPNVPGTAAWQNPGPTIFDTFSFVGSTGGTQFSALLTDQSRYSAIVSNNMFWTGANAVAANGGTPIKLYAPSTYESGSTYSHIDPSLTGVAGLLFPALYDNTFFAGPTAVELGIMKDMGWSVSAIPEPSAVALIVGGVVMGFTIVVRRRRTVPDKKATDAIVRS